MTDCVEFGILNRGSAALHRSACLVLNLILNLESRFCRAAPFCLPCLEFGILNLELRFYRAAPFCLPCLEFGILNLELRFYRAGPFCLPCLEFGILNLELRFYRAVLCFFCASSPMSQR